MGNWEHDEMSAAAHSPRATAVHPAPPSLLQSAPGPPHLGEWQQ